MTTIFFATDVHGSEICWKKFISAAKFYQADVIILGGDMTGKAIVPIVHQGGDRFKAVLLEQESMLHGEAAVAEMEKQIKSRGYYPYRTTPDEIEALNEDPALVDDIFAREVLKTAEQWLAYADEKLEGTGVRCYVAPGNDDMFELDDLICTSRHVQMAEGRVVELDEHHEMVSSGWTNFTPWKTYREEEEDKLRARCETMIRQLKNVSQAVFNFHSPPYGSTLDDVPELTEDLTPMLGGRALVPVGSHAVRDLIMEYKPLLGLHGHIHEGKGAVRLGKTLCINPGSMYEQGRLLGAVINLSRNKIKTYILTTG
ncbi:MAG: metallophosphoesterase [Anaerolineae bacterium]|jgi:Icc-related predicted phosphoesterase|nr:metallophosphoesterase [Anaerolineae bacterium]MDX9831207.1 metallophosphoesterase [Anaerolineae bacterium]